MSSGRGEANLVMKCKFCKRESSAGKSYSFTVPTKPMSCSRRNILPNAHDIKKNTIDFASKPIAYEIENNEKFATIVTIECRGLEPVDFEPRMGWKAKGAESGTVFDDVDLSEGEWVEYDDKVRKWDMVVFFLLRSIVITHLTRICLSTERIARWYLPR